MNPEQKGWTLTSLFLLLLLSVSPALSAAQEPMFQDYETYPVLDYKFTHLEAQLALNPETRSLSGIVTYTLEAKHRFAGVLHIPAAGLQINSILINEREASFSHEQDRIEIDPAAYLSDPQRPFELSISYEAPQSTALIKTAAGTLFTTLSPNRRSEWIPVVEHPRIAFTTRFSLEVTEGTEVVSNGQYFRTQSLDDGAKRVIWRSEVPVPSTDLAFFAGDLSFTETLLGLTNVRVYGEARTGSAQVREDLMREVVNSLSSITRSLRVEYPFEGFSLVMLEDHYWEPRPYAASLGMLAGTISPAKVQIDRVVASQWFGAALRSETVAGSAAVLLHQAHLMQQLEPDTPPFGVQGFPSVDGFDYWNHMLPQHFGFWHDALEQADDFTRFALSDHKQAQLRRGDPVGDWPEFQREWYRATGRTLEEPVFGSQTEEPQDTPLTVQLVFGYNSERGVSVTVDPQGTVETDSIRVPLELHFRGAEVRRDTLTVFRTGGEFVIPADTRPQNIMAGDGAPAFLFREMKDLNMWLHQLRSSDDISRRVQAAENLPRFREDPDIQLAVRDVLRAEDHPQVRAALIRAISSIVRGAAGTQQLFLDLVATAEGDEQLAAVEALRNYPGNAAVVSAIGRLAQSMQYSEAAVLAVRVFREVATEEQFTELASSLLGGSGPGAIRAAVVQELFELSDRMVAVDTSYEIALSTNFPYLMRATAMSALANHNRAQDLQELIPVLIEDTDPRMRLISLRYIGALEDEIMNDLLEQRFQVERDPRLRAVLMAF
ncbi:Peptidase family M1 [Cyclonatronum proteinivorum]|uniref:Peptidase family M1 n=1 Tax=Cyclonatronum proteinivorum TaxID=1457365 RepID=A0A345UIZ8_9BACT|nr:hypothetical protein [Cyclonatronum proteinivorum]AXJ00450.1 Peptidase family M1 [Cyclonatronum proteinivorum]